MSKTLCEARLSVRKAGGFAVLGAGGARLAPLALASAVLGGEGWRIGDAPTAQAEFSFILLVFFKALDYDWWEERRNTRS